MSLARDFVQEACAATGTADYTLTGPPASTPYVGFVAAFGSGAKVFYVVQSDTTLKWEIGWGIVTDASPDTLTRNVLASWDTVTLSTTAKISWGGGDGALRAYCAPIAAGFLGALTFHRGATAPAYPIAGMIWQDITSLTAVVWKHFDGTDWIAFPWTVNESANTVTFNGLLLGANPVAALGAAPKQYVDRGDRQRIWGLTYANGSDATNDIDIAAGGCMDATGAQWIAVSALTKQLDAAWAVGNNAGGRDTGSIGNNDYYIWAILRSDTGVTDILFSLSATTPTMPTNYDYKRLIGWFKRAGGTIVLFNTYETAGGGLDFRWKAPRLDVDLANTLTTTRRTDALSVPLDRSTEARVRTVLNDNTSSFTALICCPDETDAAPSTSASPGANIFAEAAVIEAGEMTVRTSATGTIAARSLLATVDTYRVFTVGFVDSRR